MQLARQERGLEAAETPATARARVRTSAGFLRTVWFARTDGPEVR